MTTRRSQLDYPDTSGFPAEIRPQAEAMIAAERRMLEQRAARQAGEDEECECREGMFPGRATRRGFLTAAMAGTAALPLSAAAQSDTPPGAIRFDVPDDPTKIQGRMTHADDGYGSRSQFEDEVRWRFPTATQESSWTMTPLSDGHGIVTPSGLHFERHHGGIPTIDPSRHHLIVHGMVDNPRKYAMIDLERFPALSRFNFIECSGNGLTEVKQVTLKTVQGTHGLTSTSEWTGVPLSTILREVGVQDGAAWILAEGADAAVMTRSVPLDKAWSDAMLAYAQNGEALRPEQGYPLRLILPGWEGNTHIKWLRRLEISDKPFMTREETSKYTDVRRGRQGAAVLVHHGGEVGHHLPLGRDEAAGGGVLRDHRPRLVGQWPGAQRRGLDRWRRHLVSRLARGPGPAGLPHPLPLSVAMGRPASPAAEPLHRRDRLGPADQRPAQPGARAERPSEIWLHLSLERHPDLGDRAGRRRRQRQRIRLRSPTLNQRDPAARAQKAAAPGGRTTMRTTITGLALGLLLATGANAASEVGPFGFGTTPTDDEIAAIDIDAMPDGRGLPPGQGTVAEGRAIYQEQCVACHGEDLEGVSEVGGEALIGGRGTIGTPETKKTIESYWPYSSTVLRLYPPGDAVPRAGLARRRAGLCRHRLHPLPRRRHRGGRGDGRDDAAGGRDAEPGRLHRRPTPRGLEAAIVAPASRCPGS